MPKAETPGEEETIFARFHRGTVGRGSPKAPGSMREGAKVKLHPLLTATVKGPIGWFLREEGLRVPTRRRNRPRAGVKSQLVV